MMYHMKQLTIREEGIEGWHVPSIELENQIFGLLEDDSEARAKLEAGEVLHVRRRLVAQPFSYTQDIEIRYEDIHEYE